MEIYDGLLAPKIAERLANHDEFGAWAVLRETVMDKPVLGTLRVGQTPLSGTLAIYYESDD